MGSLAVDRVARFDADYYAISPGSNPSGPKFGNKRVLRGGCWADSNAFSFRCATRIGDYVTPPNSIAPGYLNVPGSPQVTTLFGDYYSLPVTFVGFRCVVIPTER